ncbi:TetR/AcrR family transcriptional regulator [Mycolicibacter senuensis]|uniref:TetR/AcrR family transcriptional regulator n=1 Tax=Mycolicibacter senuensis TaxID=386913 RepID=UPI000DCEB5B8|nr:TetR/AcrR family transcriptional regulator [Mycolicibacter senuensis]RAV03892.1 TetR/AcrR family transcriptional regulator [Mycolicibacter senuensis]
MTVAAEISPEDGTVRGRLILAADAEIAEHGITAVQMEAIARRAGVSRATAFRQLGSISEVLVQVALLRARRHVAAVDALMAKRTGTFAKLEAALIYTARELPTDPSISALIAQHSTSVQDPRVHEVAMGVISPVLEEGRRNGEVRTDLPISELVDFLVEQTYLAAEDLDRSADVVRRRFRHFVVPGLEARGSTGGEFLSRTIEVEHAVGVAIEALGDLARHFHRDGPAGTAP